MIPSGVNPSLPARLLTNRVSHVAFEILPLPFVRDFPLGKYTDI
jgi:hypothetical protein